MHPQPLERARPRLSTPSIEGLLVGAGRSGFVFKSIDGTGRAVARKVFDSDALTSAVQYVFLGAPNPYAWSADAVECAFLRRRILAPLVRLWFGERLRVAVALGRRWNEEFRAFELETEFVEGRAPALHQPVSRRTDGEARELGQLQRALAARLVEAGFDGLAWQAGLGNPVALANFLLVSEPGGARRWCWIDLESGVPALFPASPAALFGFYLPRAWRLGRPLFDDVDVERLRLHVRVRARELDEREGPGAAARVLADVGALELHQSRWKTMPRLERSLASAVSKRRIDASALEHYRARPLRWYVREARRGARGVALRARRWTARHAARLGALPWRRLPAALLAFLGSQRFRARVAREFVERRIASWVRRGQLTPSDARLLRGQLGREESSAYLSDFGVHVALKPLAKTVEWFVLPTLFAAGRVDEAMLGIGIVLTGCLLRTAYTAGRSLQALVAGRAAPWIALAVGTLPVIGNFAYPIQIACSSRDEEDLVAQFLLYDGCAAFGARIPIWGGRDTLTEHALNRLPDRIVPRGRRPRAVGPR